MWISSHCTTSVLFVLVFRLVSFDSEKSKEIDVSRSLFICRLVRRAGRIYIILFVVVISLSVLVECNARSIVYSTHSACAYDFIFFNLISVTFCLQCSVRMRCYYYKLYVCSSKAVCFQFG